MKASVVICTYNRAELLREALRSVQQQDFPTDQFQIVVVDNNSTDRTRDVINELSASSSIRIDYVFAQQQGLSHARNQGIKAADGEIIVFTDDDAEADNSWLRELVASFDSPDVAAAGGPIKPIWLGKKPDWLTEKLEQALTINDFTEAAKKGEFNGPYYPWGANMAFRKDIFETIGMFPTQLGRTGKCLLSNEEIELCRKIEASNSRIQFAPNAIIHHKISPDRLKKIWFLHRYYWQGCSDAILDLSVKADIYARLRQYALEMLWRAVAEGQSEFEKECQNRLVKGYLHQVMEQEKDGKSFRRLRVLETFLKALISASKSQGIVRENKINDLNKYIDEKHEDLKKFSDLLKEKDDLLKQSEQKLSQVEASKNNEINNLKKYIVEKNEELKNISALIKEKDDLLKQLEFRLSQAETSYSSNEINNLKKYIVEKNEEIENISALIKEKDDLLKQSEFKLSQAETSKKKGGHVKWQKVFRF